MLGQGALRVTNPCNGPCNLWRPCLFRRRLGAVKSEPSPTHDSPFSEPGSEMGGAEQKRELFLMGKETLDVARVLGFCFSVG